MEDWCKALTERFRVPTGDAPREFQALEYTLHDVYDCQNPNDFLQRIVVLGVNSGAAAAPTTETQAMSAYSKMATALQVWLTKSDDTPGPPLWRPSWNTPTQPVPD